MYKIYSPPWNSHLCRFPWPEPLAAPWFVAVVSPAPLELSFFWSHAPTSATSKFPNFFLRFIWAEFTGIDQFHTCSWDKTIYVDTQSWEQFFNGKRWNLSLRRENLAPWTGREYPCVPQSRRGSYKFICSFWSPCHDSPIIPSLMKYLIKICTFWTENWIFM